MQHKKSFSIAAVLLVAALAACAPAAVAGGGGASEPVPQISVVGVGQVYVTPDTATINVGVRSQADTVAEALEQNNAQAIAIKETLMGQGVEEKDIQTASFNVYPQSDYDFQGNITRTYFSVENNVFVTVRDLGTLGETLDAVARSGANNIYGITFDVEDKSEAQSTTRELAVESARAQAQELAQAAGVQLGEIMSISTYTSYPMPYMDYGMGRGGGAAAYAEAVPIASGQMQITSEVSMVFRIK
jgi:hypothetical protein